MTDVGVVALQVTRGSFGADLGSRGANFKTLVSQAAAVFADRLPDVQVKLFVAPEYFFSKFDAYGTKVDGTRGELAPASHGQKMDFYDDIQSASSLQPNIIIVAGTIFYTRGKKSIEGLNVCPIAVGGRIKHKIYKQNDDQRLKDYNKSYSYETKKRSDPVFTEKGVTFALDICRDHNSGLARTFAQKKNKTVQIHILISAGAAPSQCAGTYVVHCDLTGDGKEGIGTVFQSTDGSWSGSSKTRITPVGEPTASQIEGIKYVAYNLTV